MRRARLWIITIAAVSLAWGASPAGADEPFGRFGGIAGGGNAGGGILPLHGWALDDDGVQAVDIFVDGNIAGRARYGRNRPGIPAIFPGFPDSTAAGFALRLDTSRYHNGLHEVTARVLSKSGEVVFLNKKVFEFTNTTATLLPFGRIDFPQRNAHLFGNCDIEDPERRYSVVQGWVLDSGIEVGDEGVGYVELLIDGAIYANTRTDCTFFEEAGGLVNCFGLVRQDIERLYPNLKDSPNAGFRFVLDIGALIDFGFVRGFHVLTIRSGDITGQVANVDEIPVDFFCDSDVANQGSFGFIGFPRERQTLDGTVEFSGWALDREGVLAVIVHIDGAEAGVADYGFIRPGVTALYPSFLDSAAPGWRFSVDTTTLAEGRHQMQVFVLDMSEPPPPPQQPTLVLIGERDFFVDNLLPDP